MKVYLFIIALLVANAAFTQSIFRPIPKIAKPQFGARAAGVSQPDSFVNAIRPTVVAVYVAPGNIIAGGAGFAWQHEKWDYANSRWQSQYSFGLYGLAGGSLAPQTPSDIVSLAFLVGFSNDLIRVGPMYNFKSGFGVAASFGLNFNN